MTLEEKLENFRETSLEYARQESAGELAAYEAELEMILKEHKAQAETRAAHSLKAEITEVHRISNMEISREQLRVRHEISARVDELETRLFEEAQEMLEEYRKTPGYLDWMKKQVREALDFDPESELILYIDPTDAAYKEELASLINRDNAEVRISGESFLGGTRGVIHARNILIDNSLKKKIADVRRDYQLREEL